MPNWCYNYLTVTGDAADIKLFIEKNTGHTVIAWGTPGNVAKAMEHAHKLDPPAFFFNALIPVPQEVIAKGYCLRKQGDPNDGYNWCKQNWGTKWDLDPQDPIYPERMGYREGCTKLSFSFDTPNTPPKAWFIEAARRFPTLDLEMEYREPCCGIGGSMYGNDGCVSDNEMSVDEVVAEYSREMEDN